MSKPMPGLSVEWRIQRHFAASGKQYQGVITIEYVGDASKLEMLTHPRDDHEMAVAEVQVVLMRMHDQLMSYAQRSHFIQQFGVTDGS